MSSILKLCRYFGDPVIGFKSVSDGCFRLSRPSSFNDPFDCDGRADGESGINPRFIVGEEAYERMRKSPMGLAGICMLRSETKKIWDSSGFIDGVARIMCFTRQGAPAQSHMLFWSHYANSGRGLRIRFELPRQVKDVYQIRRVKYHANLPRCNLEKISRMDNDPEARRFCENRIWTKGKAWEYEDEYRLRMYVTVRNPEYVKVDGAGDMFLRIPGILIKGVDLGPCAELKIFTPLIHELKSDRRFSHIQFTHAVKDLDRYCYRYEEI